MRNIKEFVAEWKEEMKTKVNDNCSLAIIQVGDVEASNRYVKNKLKDCEEVGIKGNLYKFPEDINTYDLCEAVHACTEKGIIVQLPLPKHIDVAAVTNAIPLEKDVDGFKLGSPYKPCTPGGIIHYLEACDFNFDGANAVVMGRSEIVGKPMAKLLLDKNCTVTVMHSHTTEGDKRAILQNADLVVCAIGKRGVLRATQAPNAFIVDVGINFDENGKLCGDVEATLERDKNRTTPVPGGVGLLTRAMLMHNVLLASEK